MIDFEALLRSLTGAGVGFIVIGGFAATLHGSARLTRDLDIVYRRSPENLARLAMALASLEPYLRGAPPGLPFRWDAATIQRGLNFTLTTSRGGLDVFGEVPGGGSYEELVSQTIEGKVFGLTVKIIELPALIRLKRAAGRPKDLEVVAELEALLEESGQEPAG